MSDVNYMAIVFTIRSLRKIEKADRLLATPIFGNNVIVGIDTKEGDKGLYFPLESQLGLEFAQKNDLIRRKNPETGKSEGGMFDDNRRVRAQTFKGEKSMGFWIPINSLKKLELGFDTQIENLQDGDELSEFNGFSISKKYIPTSTRSNSQSSSKDGKGKKKDSRLIEGQFNFHKDTLQLGKNIHQVQPDDIISITYKYHGTSAIASRVLLKRNLTWKDKLARFFGVDIIENYHDYLYASRTVVKSDSLHPGYYGEDLWTEVGKKHFEGNLKAGESIYYEIVGYTSSGKPIQKGYPYGCDLPGYGGTSSVLCYKVFVYRITYTLPDNTVIELPWNQVQERARQLGVETPLTFYYGKADHSLPLNLILKNVKDEDSWREGLLKYLQDTYLEKNCIYNPGMPAEGICIRKEGLDLSTFKLKSFRFLEKETKDLDKGEVDLETEQSQENYYTEDDIELLNY